MMTLWTGQNLFVVVPVGIGVVLVYGIYRLVILKRKKDTEIV